MLERNGTSKELTQKNTHGAVLCVQYHKPTEYNFTKTYCHKEPQLRGQQYVADLVRLYTYFK